MRWSIRMAVVTVGCGFAAVVVGEGTADAGEFFAPRIRLMNWFRSSAGDDDLVAPLAPLAPPPGALDGTAESPAPMPAEVPPSGSSGPAPWPSRTVAPPHGYGGPETPCTDPHPGGQASCPPALHGTQRCPCDECRRRYVDHIHYVPPPQPPCPPPQPYQQRMAPQQRPQQRMAPQGMPLQPQGMFTAPQGRGEIAGESNSIGLRGFAVTFPRIRIEFPTIQLPSLVRFRRNPEMRLEEAYAPYSQGTPAVYGQLMTAQRQIVTQHMPAPQAYYAQQFAPPAPQQPTSPQAAPPSGPPPHPAHVPGHAPPGAGCPPTREQLLQELREQQARIEQLQMLLELQRSTPSAGTAH